MSAELRWNPLARRWVAIAGLREARPRDESIRVVHSERSEFEPACPFCPGNEAETMPAVSVVTADDDAPSSTAPSSAALRPDGRAEHSGSWKMRVVPNKYPSFAGDTPLPSGSVVAPSSGASEVVVFTDRHDIDMADLSTDDIVTMLRLVIERREVHRDIPAVEHTSVIVNRGGNAGASMTHGHAQILSTPFVPPTVLDELEGFTTVENLADDAFGDDLRVTTRAHAVSGCPRWSAFSYETWVVPIAHTPDLSGADTSLLTDIADLLRDALRRCRAVLGDHDHNIVFRFAPHRYDGPFQWHAQVLPRHVALAGFEISSGVAVNPVPPELASQRLRDAAVTP